MSFPLVPPPITDTGGLSCPRTLQRWLDDNPATKLTKCGTFITLPVFTANVNWLGYSDIVAAFTFEGPNNFSLLQILVAGAVEDNSQGDQVLNAIGAEGGGLLI